MHEGSTLAITPPEAIPGKCHAYSHMAAGFATNRPRREAAGLTAPESAHKTTNDMKTHYTLMTADGAVLANADTLEAIRVAAKRQRPGTYYVYEFAESPDGEFSEHDPKKHFEYVVTRRLIGTTFRISNDSSDFKNLKI